MSKFYREDFNALSDDEFRALAGKFLQAAHPSHLRDPDKRLHWNDAKDWYLALSKHGWLAPAWPKQYGGMGLTPAKQLIYLDEFERFGAARNPDHGIILLGPLLIRYGSVEQKAFFLPKILSGEHIWCQGYSEPNAGSDLASLRTKAVLEGDEWVINGQKTWTTLAQDANWIFLLVRTDSSVRKQEGISFLLVPMTSKGVTVRPIQNLDLHDEFSEVFFENVRVPRDHLVGEVNQGWKMARALLGFERIFLGSPRQSSYALVRLKQLAQSVGQWNEPTFRERYLQFNRDLEDHKALFEVFAGRLRRGEDLGPDVSMLKVHQSEMFQRITDLMMEIAAERGALLEVEKKEVNAARLFLNARPATIYGGSSEIQRDILAKHFLGSSS